eukprot:980695_1
MSHQLRKKFNNNNKKSYPIGISKKFPELTILRIMDEKYNGEYRDGEIQNLIKFINYMDIKAEPREGFTPTEDIHIYLYATKGTIAKIAQFLHQKRKSHLSITLWVWLTWSMRGFTIVVTSQTSTRSFG